MGEGFFWGDSEALPRAALLMNERGGCGSIHLIDRLSERSMRVGGGGDDGLGGGGGGGLRW